MEEPVVAVRYRLDTRAAEAGYLTPFGLATGAATLELFSQIAASVYAERFYGSPTVRIERIQYSNPLDIWAAIKGLPKDVVSLVAKRLLFYPQEARRRDLENASLHEDVKMKELQRLEKVLQIRKQLIEGGIAADEATRHLADMLGLQNAQIEADRRLPQRGR